MKESKVSVQLQTHLESSGEPLGRRWLRTDRRVFWAEGGEGRGHLIRKDFFTKEQHSLWMDCAHAAVLSKMRLKM